MFGLKRLTTSKSRLLPAFNVQNKAFCNNHSHHHKPFVIAEPKIEDVPYHPSVDKKTMFKLKRYFPQAQFSLDCHQRINYALLREGSRPANTLFACSVCPDEINHYPQSLNNRLSRVAGKCFYMGGLGGIPFTGKVGYNAFTAHMPDNGNLVILFCPHVGITPDGEFGKFDREGQEGHDVACGAAIGAYRWLETNEWEP